MRRSFLRVERLRAKNEDKSGLSLVYPLFLHLQRHRCYGFADDAHNRKMTEKGESMGAAENLLFVLPPDCSKGNSHIVPRADDCIMLAGLLKAVKLCRPFDLFNIFAWRNAVIKPAVTYRFLLQRIRFFRSRSLHYPPFRLLYLSNHQAVKATSVAWKVLGKDVGECTTFLRMFFRFPNEISRPTGFSASALFAGTSMSDAEEINARFLREAICFFAQAWYIYRSK